MNLEQIRQDLATILSDAPGRVRIDATEPDRVEPPAGGVAVYVMPSTTQDYIEPDETFGRTGQCTVHLTVVVVANIATDGPGAQVLLDRYLSTDTDESLWQLVWDGNTRRTAQNLSTYHVVGFGRVGERALATSGARVVVAEMDVDFMTAK